MREISSRRSTTPTILMLPPSGTRSLGGRRPATCSWTSAESMDLRSVPGKDARARLSRARGRPHRFCQPASMRPMAHSISWASSDAIRRTMRSNRRTDTNPELVLRSALHRRGLRFRKDLPIRAGNLLVHPDVVFTRRRVAVFLDGCFWHRCPIHATDPKLNRDYWGPKLEANVQRDRRVDAALAADGWTVIRIWEHDDPMEATRRIADVVTDDSC